MPDNTGADAPYIIDISKAGTAVAGETGMEDNPPLQSELNEARDKYIRLYAEFENFKKKTAREREDSWKYANESLIAELLPVMDHLEMALKHSHDAVSGTVEALAQGVENTLREMNRVLEKFGLKPIDAINKPFDPAFHHAMTQIEAPSGDSNTVVEEFRKGYLYREKVIRPSLVAVSK